MAKHYVGGLWLHLGKPIPAPARSPLLGNRLHPHGAEAVSLDALRSAVAYWHFSPKKAHIFNKADSRGAWLSEGESMLGWRVERSMRWLPNSSRPSARSGCSSTQGGDMGS